MRSGCVLNVKRYYRLVMKIALVTSAPLPLSSALHYAQYNGGNDDNGQ
jgi:hypothetical protein